jgi:hypothetical protein
VQRLVDVVSEDILNNGDHKKTKPGNRIQTKQRKSRYNVVRKDVLTNGDLKRQKAKKPDINQTAEVSVQCFADVVSIAVL